LPGGEAAGYVYWMIGLPRHERKTRPDRGPRRSRPTRRQRARHSFVPTETGKRSTPPTWALKLMRKRSGRRLGTLLLAIIGVALVVAVSGTRVARQDIGYVGVVRNGGPFDARTIRQVLAPGQRLSWIGFFSQAPHQYPSATVNRTYSVTSDPRRGNRTGVDVVTVPTKDGVQVGLEATIFMRFVGESNLEVLEQFESSYGNRRFPGGDGQKLYPWQGDEGFSAWLDNYFRPVLDYNLRREIGTFQCAQLVASCSLVSRGSPYTTEVPLADSALIATRVSKALEQDLTRTIGKPYFSDIRMRISRVTLPTDVQAAINEAQAAFASVNTARAELKQSEYRALRNRRIGESLNSSPGLATVEAMKAIPKGSTVIVNTGGKEPSIIAQPGK
jgi:regulator of protease activity HflC (stomatin/prohibitin superfamily)